MGSPVILTMPHRNAPGRPWETLPAFCQWSSAMSPRDPSDDLLGVRMATFMAGSVGCLARAVLASNDPRNDRDEVRLTVMGECSRVLMSAMALADEIGYNPARTLAGPIDQYVIDFGAAFGIRRDEVPYEERAFFRSHSILSICGYILPVTAAVAIDAFTNDGIHRDHACEELLKGFHEIQTLLDSYDVAMSTALERQVRTITDDLRRNPQPGVTPYDLD